MAHATAGPNHYALLDYDYLGCGTFGEDDAESVADHTTTYAFGVANFDTLTTARTTQLAGYVEMAKLEALGVFLNTRH